MALLCLHPGKCTAQEPDHRAVYGTVLDMETGKPVPTASVFLPEENRGILTDTDGTLHLTLTAGTNRIAISRAGYNRLEQSITVNDTTETRLYFFLEPRVTA